MVETPKHTPEPSDTPSRWTSNLALGLAIVTALGGGFAAIAALRQVGATYVSQRFAKQSDTIADFLAEIIRFNEVSVGASNAVLFLSRGEKGDDNIFDELKSKSGDHEMAILSAGIKAQFALPPDYEKPIGDVEDDVDLIDIAVQDFDAKDASKRASSAAAYVRTFEEDTSRLDRDLKRLRYCAYQGLKANRPIEDGTFKRCADDFQSNPKTQ